MADINLRRVISQNPHIRREYEDGGPKKKDDGEFPGYLRKPEKEETRRRRRADSRRNQCGTCFTARAANGTCTPGCPEDVEGGE
jgi:hypothetical protein